MARAKKLQADENPGESDHFGTATDAVDRTGSGSVGTEFSQMAEEVRLEPPPMSGADNETAVQAPSLAVSPGSPKVSRGGSGFAGLVLGGVVAAAAGAAVALWLFPDARQPSADPDLAARAAKIEAAVSDVNGKFSQITPVVADLRNAVEASQTTLTARLEKLETGLEAAGSSTADTQAAIGSLSARLAALDGRLGSLEKRPGPDGSVSSTAIEAFQRDLDALHAELDAQKRETQAARDALVAATTDATNSIASVREETRRLQDEARMSARKTAAAAAMSHLQAALESGSPIGPALAGLAAAGIDVPQSLKDQEGGVPTLDFLRSAFPEASRAALAEALRTAPSATWGERFSNFLRSQTGARSLAPKSGDDPDSILSRAEAALSADDLPAALAEIGTLPAPAQAVLSEWTGLAAKRIAALEAVNGLISRSQ